MRYVIRERFFHLGEDSDITDEAGQPVYVVDGKVFSLRGLLVVTDANRQSEVARVERKLVSLVATYEIALADGQAAEVRKVPFTPFRERFTIDVSDGNEMEMAGNFLHHDFVITRGDATVATVSKQWVSLTQTYGVDVAPGENDVLILAAVLALDLAMDREHH
jgi:uncharacterized protein YxjI